MQSLVISDEILIHFGQVVFNTIDQNKLLLELNKSLILN